MNSDSWSNVGLRKTGAVSRMKSFQNWPGFLLDLGRRPEPHQALLESLGLQVPREGLLDDEHDAVPALAQHLPDPDAVVRRAVRPLGEEDDRRAWHAGLLSHLADVAATERGHEGWAKRVAGIEPAYPDWKSGALPLSYTRVERSSVAAWIPMRGRGIRRRCSSSRS